MTSSRACLSIVVGLSLLSVAGCGASTGPSSRLSLRRVVLYQNGIGYFERRGRVEGEALALRFGAHEVDDVLSSLTVLDSNGEQTVVSASVPQRLPGVEDEGEVSLQLHLPDDRARDLVMTYAVPTPTWRAAYRVVLPEEPGQGEAVFQVWALVHNASPEDWDHVALGLATAAPISYAIDLRTPVFASRPDATGRMVAPTVHGAIAGERSRGEADGDGIADADDLCPSDPEDFDGFQDTDGCPDYDNDADRIADAQDRCPNEPETYNGTEDEDGCPDRGHVIVEEMSITILDKVYFPRGSGRLEARSLPIIDAVAATLQGNPQITQVEVGGHASDDEGDAWTLSADRAGAVRAALVQRGVPSARLTVRPFGSTQPIDARATPDARERNRRVEFRILATTDGATGLADAPAPAAARAPGRAGAAAPRAEMAPPAPPPPSRVTVDAMARGGAATATMTVSEGTTRYDVGAPVSIPAHSSSLVTILSERVRGEAILLFRPDPSAPGSDVHPFRAARMQSPRTTTLIPGPVAIYAGGNFAGQGLLDGLHEGETVTLPYAIDGSTAVTAELESGSEPARLLSIARGVLTLEDRSIRRTRYSIRPGAHAPARIFVRHARASGHTPRGLPPETEETETALLVPVPITPETASTLVIEEITPVRRQVRLLTDLRTSITPYLETSGLPSELSAPLRLALERRTQLAELEERVVALRQQIADASQRTLELRENLGALGERPSDTRRLLESRLRDAANEIERLSRELSDAQAAAVEARAQLSEAIAALSLEETTAR